MAVAISKFESPFASSNRQRLSLSPSMSSLPSWTKTTSSCVHLLSDIGLDSQDEKHLRSRSTYPYPFVSPIHCWMKSYLKYRHVSLWLFGHRSSVPYHLQTTKCWACLSGYRVEVAALKRYFLCRAHQYKPSATLPTWEVLQSVGFAY